MDAQEIRNAVKDRYAQAALAAKSGKAACCGPTCCSTKDPITSGLYDIVQTKDLPEQAVAASLGCGNPTALAGVREGDVVLDLGSGGGIDVLLAAKRVGPTGKVYGLDMTDEMLDLARDNQRRAGATNVEFLRGQIEAIPLPDASVDLIISNCVINLSVDKDAVLREAFRALKPGGRFAVSDVVALGQMREDARRSMDEWVGCIAGALQDAEYVDKLARAGFNQITVEPWRIYESGAADVDAAGGRFASAFIRATKP